MFTVRWTKVALNGLADLWMRASLEHRANITQMVNETERQLKEAPLDSGESRDGKQRILFSNGLGCVFDVLPDSQMVVVLRIWQLPTRRRRS